MWALISATVGTVLRLMREELGIVGKIASMIIGVVWAVATAFVVPAHPAHSGIPRRCRTMPAMAVTDITLGEILIDASTIATRVGELGAEISTAYAGIERPLVLLCVLKGSMFFTADLGRALSIPAEFDCIAVRSYGEGMVSSGNVELVKDVQTQLRDRDVLMVEDIIDTGRTTAFLFDHIARHRPRSLRLVSLLNKPERRERKVELHFTGFDVPDRFVVGYGLDVAELYRNLSDIRIVHEG